MYSRYPALLLLFPYVTGLVLGPAAYVAWVLKTAASLHGQGARLFVDPRTAAAALIPIVMSAAGGIFHATAQPLPCGKTPVSIVGRITDGPWPVSGYSEKYEMKLMTGKEAGNACYCVLASGGPVKSAKAGDKVRVRGGLRAWGKRRYIDTRTELIRVVEEAGAFDPARCVYIVRKMLWEGLRSSLEPRSASLCAAMLIGLPVTVKREIKDTFRRTGTAHLLSISGLHVGLVSFMLLSLLVRLGLGERRRFWPLLASLTTFCLLTGGRIPVLRAYLVCALHLCGLKKNRYIDAFNPLFNACMIILVIQPYALFEISFQLSFAGYSSILLFLKAQKKLTILCRLRKPAGPATRPLLRKTRAVAGKTAVFLGVSCAAWLGTLPLTLYYFNYFCLLTPLINFIVFPAFVAALLAGAIHLSMILPGLHLSLITAWPAEACISLFYRLLERCSAMLPHLSSRITIPGALVLLIYAGMACLLVLLSGNPGFSTVKAKKGYKNAAKQ